jgi:putative PEP-CTERM system TPR-repeat lipoprotein
MTDLSLGDVDLFSQTGIKLAAIGDLVGAKELLAKATKRDDSNVSSKLREAMINIGTNENAVIDGLNVLLAQDPAVSRGWMQLAMAHVRNGDEKSALDVAKNWSQSNPAAGKTLTGVIYFTNNKLDLAVIALKEALSIEPNYIGAHQYLMQAYEKLKRDDDLYAQAQQVLSFAPANNMPALLGLVTAAQRLDKREEAEHLIRNLSAQNKDDVGPYMALALSARLNGDSQGAINLLASRTAQLDALGFMTLGDAYLNLGQTEQALSTYVLWQEKLPNTLIPKLRAIGVTELKGDNKNALRLTEEALKQFPKRSSLQMLKLNYLTKLGQTDAAKDLLKEIKARGESPQNGLLVFYEGQLALSEKKYAQAEALLSAHHKTSATFTSVMMLAQAMQGNNHITRARNLLEAELARQDNVPARLRHILAEFYSYNGFYTESAEQYEKLLELEEETPVSLNNFAYALQGMKQFDRARDMAKKALLMAPNTPSIMDTVGWIEFESGNTAEAFKHLNEALKLAPKANDIILHLAEVQIVIGQKEQAKSLLRKLEKPTKSEVAKRDALLNKV